MSLLKASGVSLAYGNKIVLRDVDFHIDRAEIVTIVGPNGSGKSSLLKGLIGSLNPIKGTFSRAANLKIGYVPQKLMLGASLPITVARFLSLPVRVPQEQLQAALKETGADGLENHQMNGLSGGQMQRVLLARALLGDPDILILDEPTQGLDQPGAAAFYRQLETIRSDHGCAVLMVSHDLHVVMAASDRVLCLNGHVCCEGTPQVVAQAPQYRALFGTGTHGALALYRHEHDHSHNHDNT